jgi:hypothetical protein
LTSTKLHDLTTLEIKGLLPQARYFGVSATGIGALSKVLIPSEFDGANVLAAARQQLRPAFDRPR